MNYSVVLHCQPSSQLASKDNLILLHGQTHTSKYAKQNFYFSYINCHINMNCQMQSVCKVRCLKNCSLPFEKLQAKRFTMFEICRWSVWEKGGGEREKLNAYSYIHESLAHTELYCVSSVYFICLLSLFRRIHLILFANHLMAKWCISHLCVCESDCEIKCGKSLWLAFSPLLHLRSIAALEPLSHFIPSRGLKQFSSFIGLRFGKKIKLSRLISLFSSSVFYWSLCFCLLCMPTNAIPFYGNA